jgi:hypothetical protein
VPQLYVMNVSVPSEVEEAIDGALGRAVVGDTCRIPRVPARPLDADRGREPRGRCRGRRRGPRHGDGYAGGVSGGSSTPPPMPAWHVARQGRPVGPLDFAALAAEIAAGRVSRGTSCGRRAMSAWEPAEAVAALRALFPPPLPGASN